MRVVAALLFGAASGRFSFGVEPKTKVTVVPQKHEPIGQYEDKEAACAYCKKANPDPPADCHSGKCPKCSCCSNGGGRCIPEGEEGHGTCCDENRDKYYCWTIYDYKNETMAYEKCA
mmetsp:Transcript_41122/g.87035  ORF Transcript_41122/g.87035 Transcript_41122/m.87035 type:complete len:117 (+) Transcript_41122:70-420(+)|eukprot:CAMPEP_0204393090 /NCGR_PEP_ID=MMETSP0469-20131031/62131_1 /ASSEMBLY_ACC=CAM_ASM_000384 /TAXON_ID=2969 /ORGANISM="Oxyrrhis marina" /LENGTH=116 /DNA_ID=CAMNT_0051387137 /DNA_START=63 /DNA_END=413 /DNA_ORIENTATION=-